jgi:hypothetical protein
MTDTTALAQTIQRIDFDHPFVLAADGTITDTDGIYAPTVTVSETEDVDVDGPWEPITGMSLQYGYHGAIMHPSEYVGPGIAKRLLSIAEDSPATFVIVEVIDIEEPDALIGWAILQHG